MTDWKQYVGKRILMRTAYKSWGDAIEATVVEVTPSGENVKFKFTGSGFVAWKSATDYDFVELLDYPTRCWYITKGGDFITTKDLDFFKTLDKK